MWVLLLFSHGAFIYYKLIKIIGHDQGDNVKKGDDIPVDNTVPAEVETGGSSQQAAPDATAVPNGKGPQEPSAKAARFMIWQQSYFISKNAFASMLVFF